MWNYTDTVPFTNGILDWRVEVVPLTVDLPMMQNINELFADSVVPSVCKCAAYDHEFLLNPDYSNSDYRPTCATFQCRSNGLAQWINDYDFNGLPSPDEYQSFSDVLLPNDMTALLVNTPFYSMMAVQLAIK